jgi:hypothetical protein
LTGRETSKKGSREPRKHHIIPTFYLAGFTSTGSPEERLHVFDYATARRYVSTPRKVCRETDFYRVEEPRTDPTVIEKVMAEHEALVAPFVQHIAKTGTVTHKRQVGEALALAALVAVRNRRGRHQIQIALAAGLAKRLRSGQVTPAQWEQLRASETRR